MRELIVKLAKHITDCMDVTLGKAKMDESRPEYWMLDEILTDEMAQLMLKMKVRKPYTPAELAKRIGWEESRVGKLLEELAQIGIVEYNWHNADLLDKGRMETTVTRAKEIAPMAEKMISLGKKKDLAAYRQALAFITREDVAKKTFDELSVKYADRNGGYTRITRIGPRRGDAAEMAVIELV